MSSPGQPRLKFLNLLQLHKLPPPQGYQPKGSPRRFDLSKTELTLAHAIALIDWSIVNKQDCNVQLCYTHADESASTLSISLIRKPASHYLLANPTVGDHWGTQSWQIEVDYAENDLGLMKPLALAQSGEIGE
jgi:hypothetical protein